MNRHNKDLRVHTVYLNTRCGFPFRLEDGVLVYNYLLYISKTSRILLQFSGVSFLIPGHISLFKNFYRKKFYAGLKLHRLLQDQNKADNQLHRCCFAKLQEHTYKTLKRLYQKKHLSSCKPPSRSYAITVRLSNRDSK